MGYNQSKENKEIIISQAGNSGGATSGLDKSFTTWEIGYAVIIILILIFVGAYIWRRCMKKLEKRIRLEVSRSQELVSMRDNV